MYCLTREVIAVLAVVVLGLHDIHAAICESPQHACRYRVDTRKSRPQVTDLCECPGYQYCSWDWSDKKRAVVSTNELSSNDEVIRMYCSVYVKPQKICDLGRQLALTLTGRTSDVMVTTIDMFYCDCPAGARLVLTTMYYGRSNTADYQCSDHMDTCKANDACRNSYRYTWYPCLCPKGQECPQSQSKRTICRPER